MYRVPAPDAGHEQLPDPGRPERAHRVAAPLQPSKSPVTRTPRAFGAHTANEVPGDRPGRRVVGAHVRAEHLPQPLVPALADQVQVDLAERRQPPVRIIDHIQRPP